VGLGAGCLAAYGQPGQHFTFYEIDPAMRRAAERYFSFLHDSRATCDVVLGDARLRLAEAPDGQFSLIVIDAFSSDAVPIHLITREAFELYFRKLTPDGVILVHITSRYLDLRPVFGNLARDLNIVGRCLADRNANFPGKESSTWAVLARRSKDVKVLPTTVEWQTERALLTLSGHTLGPGSAAAELLIPLSGPWEPLPLSSRIGVWRDDFSNLWSAFR
jgi:spermidine synthase